jgi:hypothetical protein
MAGSIRRIRRRPALPWPAALAAGALALAAGGLSAASSLLWGAGTGVSGAWAYLCTARAAPREALERIAAAAGTGAPAAEAVSWVYLCGFDELEKVTLNDWDARVEPWDPRNDGYADALKAVFAHNGKHYAFFHLRGAGPWARRAFRRAAEQSLGPSGGEAGFLSGARNPLPGFLLCLAASFAALLLFPKKRSFLLLAAPSLGALGLAGPAGVSAAGLLGALACLWGPLEKDMASIGARQALRERRAECLAGLVLAALGGAAAALGAIPPFAAPAALAGVLGTGLAAAWGGRRGRGRGRHHFEPLQMLPAGGPDLSFIKVTVPFAAAAMVLLCVETVQAGGLSAFKDDEAIPLEALPVLSEKAFEAHAAFQAGFPYTRLVPHPAPHPAGGGGRGAASYPHYERGADGLIREAGEAPRAALEWERSPLAELSAFAAAPRGSGGTGGTGWRAWAALALGLAPCLALLRRLLPARCPPGVRRASPFNRVAAMLI